jgi:aldose 1-epimerase
MEALITNYGATVIPLKIPDRHGKLVDVTLGYDSLEEYLGGGYYFGCIVGRYANRIAGGKFILQGQEYTLAKNSALAGQSARLWFQQRARTLVFTQFPRKLAYD